MDTLSWKAVVAIFFAISVLAAIQLEEIRGEVDKDQHLQKLISEIQQDPASHHILSLVQEKWLDNTG